MSVAPLEKVATLSVTVERCSYEVVHTLSKPSWLRKSVNSVLSQGTLEYAVDSEFANAASTPEANARSGLYTVGSPKNQASSQTTSTPSPEPSCAHPMALMRVWASIAPEDLGASCE